jgi:hypothetical protein
MIIKRDFDIIKQEDKKNFLIRVYIEDELTPEDALKKLKEGQDALKALQQDLDSIPTQVEARTKTLTEQRDFIKEEVMKFYEIEKEAKLWNKINEKVEERKPIGIG